MSLAGNQTLKRAPNPAVSRFYQFSTLISETSLSRQLIASAPTTVKNTQKPTVTIELALIKRKNTQQTCTPTVTTAHVCKVHIIVQICDNNHIHITQPSAKYMYLIVTFCSPT